MLVKYWTAFFYPGSDDLTVTDGSFTWALLFHHEEEVFFGSNVARAEPPPYAPSDLTQT